MTAAARLGRHLGHDVAEAALAAKEGWEVRFGRVVGSDTEPLSPLVRLVWRGWTAVRSDDVTDP
jgi:hypothetical protein